jgi:AGZA family xanthine/uracil permease-like MFS transporter
LILTIIPLVALLPILLYIGMVITTQAFATTEKKHMPAVALSFIPLIAGFVTLQIKNAIATTGMPIDYQALANTGIPLLGWERLGAGDILIGMLIATIAIFIIDKKYLVSAVYAVIAGLLAFFGFIHAPAIGWATGWEVALGYGSMAVVLVAMNFYRKHDNVVDESEVS